MAEQWQPLRERRTGGPSGLDDPLAVHSEEFGGLASVNGEEVPVSGMTLGEIRRRLADRFGIDARSQTFVDGQPVDDEGVVVRTGQCVEFLRTAGEKGVGPISLRNASHAPAGMPSGPSGRCIGLLV